MDNIPGVPGIGPKRASHLIQKYGSVEGVYEHIDELKGKLRENLENHKADAYQSRMLASLRRDVPITLQLDEYRVRDFHFEMLEHLFSTLQFKGLYNAIVAAQPDLREVPHTVIQVEAPSADPAPTVVAAPPSQPTADATPDATPMEETVVAAVTAKPIRQMAFDFSGRSGSKGTQ